ncbi:uncharacterized protein LOC129224189 [Uloborus diversus]|uniref:uncharacterized protein LOC129224189 n=1 Tax=Uloborus diversus TaxID=327109 RepID=UPI0024099168|nr:uncharacterized protein LOC129224189 [Uloborus diversus]
MNELNESDLLFIEKFLSSFQTLGGNESGLIDYNHFKSLFLQKFKEDGKEALQCLEAEKCVDTDSFDFIKLCKIILMTKAAFNKVSVENKRILPSSPRINTHTYTKKRANAVTSRKVEKITSPKKRFTHKIKGTLYNLIEDCFSNRYLLDIAENTDVEILVKPVSHLEGGQTLYPVEVLVLPQEGPGLISCSTAVNLEGFCTTNASLKKGKYTVVPVLLNWAAEASHLADNGFFESLTELYEDESTFNSALVIILQAIFCSVDLDEDGFLNRQEFDLFAEYVLGEHAEEWSVKIDDRLSFSEFVEECKFVLETDPSRFLHMFQQMGIDGSLKQKNAQSFTLIINSTSSKLALRPLSIAAYSSLAEKYFKKIAVEKGSSKKVKNMNDLVLYTHKLPHRATMVIQNQKQ